jgi:Na+/proline symporter
MLVRDWWPGSASWDGPRKLRAYRLTTVVYGGVAALIAWLGPITSILGLLLFAFAMVVPPAISVMYLLYWKRTTETGVFWGTVSGYVLGLFWYVATPAALLDPSYVTTIVPLIVVPVVSLMTREDVAGRDTFYAAVSGTL